MRRPAALALATALAVALGATAVAGCGASGDGRTLVVFAAASLTEPFQALAGSFQRDHPGVRVRFDFAASSSLARRLRDGAPADVFASADEATMRAVVDDGLARRPVVFARNRPAVLVARGNPEGITGPADLAGPGIVLALCAPEVPCGRLAAATFRAADVSPPPAAATLEADVKAVVAKVVLGEADAGIVYRSDVRTVGDRATGIDVDVPGVETAYPVAAVAGATHPADARAWVALVTSPEGRRVLAAAGFLAP